MSVLNFEVLLKFNNNHFARNLLHQIAKHVECIMKKRMWVVHNLCEFCPKDKHLLGLNVDRGDTIRIRLRKHQNTNEFIPLPELLDTMLHELAHIQVANHSRKFYALWDELRDEWEQNALINFTSVNNNTNEGKKLDDTKHNPSSIREARLKALESAEKRAKLGLNSIVEEEKIELTRITANNWCGTDDTNNDIIIENWSCPVCTMINNVTNDNCSACNTEKPNDEIIDKFIDETTPFIDEEDQPPSESLNEPPRKKWKCTQCTLINVGCDDKCQACDSQYTLVEWECKFCTFKNSGIDDQCEMCNEIN